jgi:hypothetical protein
MSVKIYNGFKTELSNLEFLDKLSDIRQKLVLELNKKFYLNLLINHNYKVSQKVLDKELKELLEALNNDFLELTIFPLKNKILFLKWGKILENYYNELAKFEDYHYQDQSDKPKEISSQKWNLRKRDWQIALGDDFEKIPGNSGYSYSLLKASDLKTVYLTNYKLLQDLNTEVPEAHRLENFYKYFR